jgi:hypothetical protein
VGSPGPIPEIPPEIEINNSKISRYGRLTYLVNVGKINGNWGVNGMKKPQK